MTLRFEPRLKETEKRYNELERLLSSQEVISNREKFQQYSKELGELKGAVEKYREYKKVLQETKEAIIAINIKSNDAI